MKPSSDKNGAFGPAINILLTFLLFFYHYFAFSQGCSSGCSTVNNTTNVSTSSNGQVICITSTPSGNVNVNINNSDVTIRVCADSVTFNNLNISQSNFTVETWGKYTTITGANVNTGLFSYITHAVGAKINSGNFNSDFALESKDGGGMTVGTNLNPGKKLYITVDTGSTMNTQSITANNGGVVNVDLHAALNVTGDFFVQSSTQLNNFHSVNVTGNMTIQGGVNALNNACGESVINVGGAWNLMSGSVIMNGQVKAASFDFNSGGPINMGAGALMETSGSLTQNVTNALMYAGATGGCATLKVSSISSWNNTLSDSSGIHYCGPAPSSSSLLGNATSSCTCNSSPAYCDPALSVIFSQFEGFPSGGGIQLEWTTENEHDVSYYEIVRVSDAHLIDAIGSVAAKGSSDYWFYDSEPLNGTNYYQIVEHDRDGSAFYSSLIFVSYENPTSFTLYPSFAKSGNFLKIDCKGGSQGGNLELISLDGKDVFTLPIQADQTAFMVPNISVGIYIARIVLNNGSVFQDKLFITE